MPVAKRVDAGGRERLEAIDARLTVRHPQAEHEGAMRRVDLADRVVEVREPAFVELEELRHEAVHARNLLNRHGLPEGNRRVASGRHDAILLDVQRARERGEGRSGALGDSREDRRVLSEIRERVVVERGQPVADQRRRPVRHDRRHEFVARDAAVEDRVAPYVRRQRDGDQLGQLRIQRDGGNFAARGFLAQALKKRVNGRLVTLRVVVDQPGDFGEEAAAIGSRVDAERARERRGTAGDRYVLGDRDRGGQPDRKCRYNRRAEQPRQQARHIPTKFIRRTL